MTTAGPPLARRLSAPPSPPNPRRPLRGPPARGGEGGYLRWSLYALLALLLAFPFFWRLDAEEFHGDESHWISSGRQALALVAAGRLDDPQWRDEFYFYSQPQVGKLLIGLALAGAGTSGPAPIFDYDWQLRLPENRAAGRVPPPEAVLAGRAVGALSGWIACLALWRIGALLGSPLGGAASALLLASHPLWLANARRAGLDAPALALGLLAALLALLALRRWRAGSAAGAAEGGGARGTVAWLAPVLLAGVLAGLAAGTKYVAVLAFPVAIVPAALALRERGPRPRLALAAGGALALLAGALVFLATNPALYADPAGGLRASYDFLSFQAEGMRERSPVFRSPPLVAAEVIDRAVWPLGFPAVLDVTLPEPLRPGSYGTPVVGIAALLALLGLLVRPGGPPPGRATLTAAAWAAAVYLALVLSVPIWWERWHLPLVPPLCLLAGLGLARLGAAAPVAPWRARGVALFPAGAQLAAALAMGPSYLGWGFGALLATPVGLAAHLLTVPVLLVHFSAGRRLFAVKRRTREAW